MRPRLVLSTLGVIVAFIGVFQLVAVPVSWYYRSPDLVPILLSSLVTIVVGVSIWLLLRTEPADLRTREAFAIVSLSWVVASLFGSLPFLLSGAIPSLTDAFFETMSGFTTTGATILNDVESLSHGLLLWRSFTQWIGGLGIILFSVAILPFLGVGGMQLFQAEVPGLTVEKLTPRISQTARILWGIYIALTVTETAALMVAGMGFFDALNNSFTTISTGGFSTKNASIAAFSAPAVEWIIVVFMFLAGINFTLHFRFLRNNLRPTTYLADDEFRFYCGALLAASVVIFFSIPSSTLPDTGERLRATVFQVVSITTTTGFVSFDYDLWVPATQLILLLMMFHGGSAGSTAGGIKIVRVLILLRNGLNQMKMLVHPKAVIPIRLNGRAIAPEIVVDVLAFLMLYISIFVIATVVMTGVGMDIISAAGAVAAALGNIGPGLGSVGATDTYAHVPVLGKWLLSFCMLVGRLELFTVLILFTATFWKQ
jgi:trk system potassium uptake protein TrkH